MYAKNDLFLCYQEMTELFDLSETKYLEDGLWLTTTDREGSQRMNILSFV